MKIRVAIVDDHRVVRGGLASFLESFPDLEVAGLAGSGEEALDKVPGWAPDVVVMDLRLAGGLDGLETTRRLLAASPGLRVVVLTAHPDERPLVAGAEAALCRARSAPHGVAEAFGNCSQRPGTFAEALGIVHCGFGDVAEGAGTISEAPGELAALFGTFSEVFGSRDEALGTCSEASGADDEAPGADAEVHGS